jgi:hypothetical protein
VEVGGTAVALDVDPRHSPSQQRRAFGFKHDPSVGRYKAQIIRVQEKD